MYKKHGDNDRLLYGGNPFHVQELGIKIDRTKWPSKKNKKLNRHENRKDKYNGLFETVTHF